MLKTVKPNELTDDEIVAMVEIIKVAADRKQKLSPAWCTSIWCDPASARGVRLASFHLGPRGIGNFGGI